MHVCDQELFWGLKCHPPRLLHIFYSIALSFTLRNVFCDVYSTKNIKLILKGMRHVVFIVSHPQNLFWGESLTNGRRKWADPWRPPWVITFPATGLSWYSLVLTLRMDQGELDRSGVLQQVNLHVQSLDDQVEAETAANWRKYFFKAVLWRVGGYVVGSVGWSHLVFLLPNLQAEITSPGRSIQWTRPQPYWASPTCVHSYGSQPCTVKCFG